MKNFTAKTQVRQLLPELGRFGVVGGITLLLYTVLFFLLTELIGGSFFPALIAALVAALVSYVLQRNWTFRSTADIRESLPKFFIIHGAAAVLNGLCVEFVHGALQHPMFVALIFGAVIYGIFSYLAQKLWCFRI